MARSGKIVDHKDKNKRGQAYNDEQKPFTGTGKLYVRWNDGTSSLVSVQKLVHVGYFD